VVSDPYLEDLERYLRQADVIDRAAFAVTAPHVHPTYRVILTGAVAAMVKPSDEIADGPALVGREVAAWVLAKALGWPDLLATTVLRDLPSRGTRLPVRVSLQVIWPDCLPDAPPERFGPGDTWRAAVFDAIVGQTDRAGHNWLAVPGAAGQPRLKLIDHGYCFTTGMGPPGSTFYELHSGEPIPTPHLDAIRSLLGSFPVGDLGRLLPPSEVTDARRRAETLLERGVLQLP
jgi:hypothetical protein